MIEIKKWMSCDGVIFDNQYKCEKHEYDIQFENVLKRMCAMELYCTIPQTFGDSCSDIVVAKHCTKELVREFAELVSVSSEYIYGLDSFFNGDNPKGCVIYYGDDWMVLENIDSFYSMCDTMFKQLESFRNQ